MLLRYEDLVRAPRTSVERVVAALAPDARPLPDSRIPSFTELQRTDQRFFRRGRTGMHRDELPDGLHDLFWSIPENRAAMRLLGYDETDDDSETMPSDARRREG